MAVNMEALGMCKDYHWVLVQVERNYKLIQNQTTDREEQTCTGRTLRTGKPAGRSTIRYIISVHASNLR